MSLPFVYEVRDVTDDEGYIPHGLYASLDDAIASLAEEDLLEDPTRRFSNYADDERVEVAIVRHKTDGSRTNPETDTVWVQRWSREWDEETDEDVWHLSIVNKIAESMDPETLTEP